MGKCLNFNGEDCLWYKDGNCTSYGACMFEFPESEQEFPQEQKESKTSEAKKMINKKSWKEFRDSGMLWWINMMLHTMGWAITYQFDENGNITEVYPARVRFRGFDNQNDTEGYIKVSQYMKDNADELLEEALD